MKSHILKEFMYSSECQFPKTVNPSFFLEGLSSELRSFADQFSSLPSDSIIHDELLKRKEELNRFIEAIIASLSLYLSGKYSQSQKQFYHAMEWLDTHYDVGRKNHDYHSFPDIFGSTPEFYRAAAAIPSSVRRIFHLPYEMRGNAAAQRFNIPGMPCLYLGKSIYVCKQELGEKLEGLSFSRFKVNDDKIDKLKFWNFAEPPSLIFDVFQSMLLLSLASVSLAFQDSQLVPEDEVIRQGHEAILAEFGGFEKKPEWSAKVVEHIANNGQKADFFFHKFDIDESQLCQAICKRHEYNTETLFKHNPNAVSSLKNMHGYLQTGIADVVNGLVLHPLKIALTIKVDNYTFPFKFSYILPQLFMQWLSEKNIADAENLYGVSYLSSKLAESQKISSWNLNLFRNYAFPSIPRKNGYCEKLIDFFSVTEPTNILEALCDSNFNMSSFPTVNPNRNCTTDYGTKYENTLDYKFEQFLDGVEIKPLRSYALNPQ